jgi:hypothetical protein
VYELLNNFLVNSNDLNYDKTLYLNGNISFAIFNDEIIRDGIIESFEIYINSNYNGNITLTVIKF